MWAKAEGEPPTLSLAIINPEDFTLYGNQSVELSGEWTRYEMIFTAPSDLTVLFTIDLGKSLGRIYLDDIAITKS